MKLTLTCPRGFRSVRLSALAGASPERSAYSAVWRKRSANGWAAASVIGAHRNDLASLEAEALRFLGASGATVNPNASTAASRSLTKQESPELNP